MWGFSWNACFGCKVRVFRLAIPNICGLNRYGSFKIQLSEDARDARSLNGTFCFRVMRCSQSALFLSKTFFTIYKFRGTRSLQVRRMYSICACVRVFKAQPLIIQARIFRDPVIFQSPTIFLPHCGILLEHVGNRLPEMLSFFCSITNNISMHACYVILSVLAPTQTVPNDPASGTMSSLVWPWAHRRWVCRDLPRTVHNPT